MAPQRRTLTQFLVFSLGLFAAQTFWGFNSATLPLYLMELTGSRALSGLILSIGGIFGAVMPVAAGILSDRTHTPWGRRKPYILAGWTLVVIALLLLPWTRSIAVALVLSLVLYAGVFTAIGPYFALLPDLTPQEQRGTASGVMFMMGGVGILSFLIFGARSWDISHRLPFLWAALAIAVSVAVMIAGTSEPVEGMPPAGSGSLLREAVRNRPVLIFLTAMVCWWTGLWMVIGFFVIAFKERFHMSTEAAVLHLLLLIAVFIVSALPVGKLGDRVGHKPVVVTGLLLLIGSLSVIGLTDSMAVVRALLVLSGIGYSILLTVAFTFFLRLIPTDRTAGYVGIYMSCQNGALLLGPAIGGICMDVLGTGSLFACTAVCITAGLLLLLRIGSPVVSQNGQARK
ncbi:MAG: MFS transporter [Spirochaetes bacterium]|nr:MFS transporter [Spirochaetota bacterium]